jgi:hypothetical protein
VRWIDTIELTQAISYGYKAEIIAGIDFPESKKVDSENLFEPFVSHFFSKKANAKDSLERTIAKLTLNSLYGKFGQKDISSRIRLVTQEEAEKLVKKYHYTYLSEICKDKILIKYGSKLNEKLRRLYKEDETDKDVSYLSKERGVVSAVQISSRISALARVSINKFKNMEGNILYYSDTDSLVLEKPLDENLIGPGLGQWKLEAQIKLGIFVRPKLYYYETENGDIKKVSAGVDPSLLIREDYEELAKGEPVQVKMSKIIVDWKKLEIKNVLQKITLKKKKDLFIDSL